MGEIKNLLNNAAIQKLQDLAKDETCLFCTYLDEINITTRPMSTQTVDEGGCFWLFSSKDSNKNQEIQNNSKVYLQFANAGKENYLSVSGEGKIITDRNKIHQLWNPIVKTWFTEGKDDPEITLIKITPMEAYYWDTKHGKMIAFLKIMTGALIGKTMDDGIEGKLEI